MSVVVAVCALLFTIASFWWLQARKGRLLVAEPHSFALASTTRVFLVRLPLLFYNSGPRPYLVSNMRVWVRALDQSTPFSWRTVRTQLRPDSDDVKDFPTPFAVDGRSTVAVIAEFGRSAPLGVRMMNGDYEVVVEAKLGEEQSWTEILNFVVHLRHDHQLDQYIAYSNELIGEDDRVVEAAVEDLTEIVGDLSRHDQGGQ